MKNLIIDGRDSKRIQIKDVQISNDVLNMVIKKDQVDKDVKQSIANNFEKYLSINQNISVLPYIKDQSVGKYMTGRFANGDVYNLQIPESDFDIYINAKKLRKALATGNNVEDVYAYVAIVNFVFKSDNKEYFDADIKNAIAVRIPKRMIADDRSHYIEALAQLSNIFTKQLSQPEAEWIEKWVESKGNVKDQIQDVNQTIKSH
jgi:hypothetical protein